MKAKIRRIRRKIRHGIKREDLKERRVEGERRPAKSKKLSRSKERGSLSVDPGSGQEKALAKRLVRIEWIDSYGCSANWQKRDVDSVAPLVCQSVGWLAYDGKDCKVVVPHLTDCRHPYIAEQGCGELTRLQTEALGR